MGISQKMGSNCGKIVFVRESMKNKEPLSEARLGGERKEGRAMCKPRGQARHKLVQSITVISECIFFRISHPPEKGNTLSEKSCLTIFM